MKQYYTVEFKFQGKESCRAHSADFVIDTNATYHEVLERAQSVASQKLQQMFSKVLPDECLPHLTNPEYVKVIPHQSFF